MSHIDYECMLADMAHQQQEEEFAELQRQWKENEEKHWEEIRQADEEFFESQQQMLYESQLEESLHNKDEDEDWDDEGGNWVEVNNPPYDYEEFRKSLPLKQREPFRMKDETKWTIIIYAVLILVSIVGVGSILLLVFALFIGLLLLLF